MRRRTDDTEKFEFDVRLMRVAAAVGIDCDTELCDDYVQVKERVDSRLAQVTSKVAHNGAAPS